MNTIFFTMKFVAEVVEPLSELVERGDLNREEAAR